MRTALKCLSNKLTEAQVHAADDIIISGFCILVPYLIKRGIYILQDCGSLPSLVADPSSAQFGLDYNSFGTSDPSFDFQCLEISLEI